MGIDRSDVNARHYRLVTVHMICFKYLLRLVLLSAHLGSLSLRNWLASHVEGLPFGYILVVQVDLQLVAQLLFDDICFLDFIACCKKCWLAQTMRHDLWWVALWAIVGEFGNLDGWFMLWSPPCALITKSAKFVHVYLLHYFEKRAYVELTTGVTIIELIVHSLIA